MSLTTLEKTLNALKKSCLVSYAQEFEDIILYRMLHDIQHGFYVDVGCGHPQNISVTKFFYERGWRGMNIDPRAGIIDLYAKERPEDINLNIAVSNQARSLNFYEWGDMSTFDYDNVRRLGEDKFKKPVLLELKTLTQVFDEALPDRIISFLKIDVEKHEKEVLQGLDLNRYRPLAIAIESTLPCTSTACYHEWEHILNDNAYKIIYEGGINRYYAPREQYDRISANMANCRIQPFIKFDQLQNLCAAFSEIKTGGETDNAGS